jgi:N-acyl-D-aspartate/D-glutamate deacylase
MSGQPAELFRLRGRGRIAVGYHADLVAFDPDTVAAREVERRWDFPANGDRLVSESEGVDSVWVNGTRIREAGNDIEGVAPGVLVP